MAHSTALPPPPPPPSTPIVAAAPPALHPLDGRPFWDGPAREGIAFANKLLPIEQVTHGAFAVLNQNLVEVGQGGGVVRCTLI
jgi:hypothetical protein